MKRLLGLFAVWAILILPISGSAQDARLQVIHNAADTLAATVDIYVNGDIFIDDFAFRSATEFRTVPAGVTLNIGVAPGNSGSASDTIANFPVVLEAGKTYVAIANGLVDATGATANPDGASIGFTIFARDGVREKSRFPWQVDLLAFHGSTDAPTVDIFADIWGHPLPLFRGLSYGNFKGYKPALPLKYTLIVAAASNSHRFDEANAVARFKADLRQLGGGAATVFASGFLNPAAGEPTFGLFAALPNGDVAPLPAIVPPTPEAELQLVHNAADPAAATVDIYVNGDLYKDDFTFRSATPFETVPAEVPLEVGVAPGNSSSAADTLASFTVTLKDDQKYVVFANGVIGDGFAANPDPNRSIGFSIFPFTPAETSGPAHRTRVLSFHGVTDAPEIDIKISDSHRWHEFRIRHLGYGDFDRYRSFRDREYELTITPSGSDLVVGRFTVDFRPLRGQAGVLFASGFLAPQDMDQPSFGLFFVGADGAVSQLEQEQPLAQAQIIHNAADPAAKFVDIYLGDTRIANNFEFRTATPFLDLPAETDLIIGVADSGSMSVEDTIVNFTVNLKADEQYVVVANGVIGGGFTPNPDPSIAIDFSLFPFEGAKTRAGRNKTNILAFHGATDAPTVDVVARAKELGGPLTLIDDLSYGQYQGYAAVPSIAYNLDVTTADQSVVVGTFAADLSDLAKQALVVFASGFLTPLAMDDPSFGLYAALPSGMVVKLPQVEAEAKTAELQVIHNAADTLARVVDVYVNGEIFIDDFAFRTATPFAEVPAGVALEIGVAPGNSSSAADTIASFEVTLEPYERYVVVANGVIAGDFADNPDGASIGFSLFPFTPAKSEARRKIFVELAAFHGVTDAPTVDIVPVRANRWGRNHPLFDNLSYGNFADYRRLLARTLYLNVTPGDDNDNVLLTYRAPLRSLRGQAAVVFASGFLAPQSVNEPGFGLFVALGNGDVVALEQVTTGSGGMAALANGEAELPATFALEQNFPNPFNPTTQIPFSLPTAGEVNLTVYNVLGQEVARLVDGFRAAGEYTVEFDGGNLASGIYFYRLQTGTESVTKRMVLIK